MTDTTAPQTVEHRKPGEEEIVFAWWRETISSRDAPTGPRAELRRAQTPEEVFLVPLFPDLRARLAGTRWSWTERLALVAGVLAHVEAHRDRDESGHPRTFARQMAAPRPGGGAQQPRISPARFRRLLRVADDDLETLFQLVRRAVRLLDGEANVTDLASSLYWWGPDVRKRWALDYYALVDERQQRS